MAHYSLLQHFMVDELTLRRYKANKKVSPAHLYENLVQCAHQANSFIPDHYFKAWGRMAFQSVTKNSAPDVINYFTELLPQFADCYLTLDANHVICVKEHKWNEWQLVAREFSPSVMKVFFMYNQKKKDTTFEPSEEFWKNNFYCTALPCSHDNFIREKRSALHDLHVHAGSSLEADSAWLNLLQDPKFFISDSTKYAEDFKINGIVQSRLEMYQWVLRSRRLIQTMRNTLDGIHSGQSLEKSLWYINNGLCRGCYLSAWFGSGTSALQEEAKFLWEVLANLSLDKLAYWLHYYLLIKGVFRNFLIVQSSQNGLEQFNHTLHAPYRGGAMDYLHKSLQQMVGNDLQGAQSIELRVGPSHLKDLIHINDAIFSLQQLQANAKTKVPLVCHLIKEVSKPSKKNLYKEQCKKVRKHFNDFVGIDVAGSDFKASPGAFIEVFKEIRKEDKYSRLHYTYHAGEDFFHLLDGMRMVWEAVEFLKFKEGDRIGHASALGVDPKLWADNLGECLPIARGRYFDNLMFVIYLCYRNQVNLSHQTWIRLIKKAKEVSKESSDYLSEKSSVNLDSGIFISNQTDCLKWINNREQCDAYESSDVYKQVIEVGCFDVFSREDLIQIQQALLRQLKDKGIAIETTPTSNVTIGHHHSFRSYHLLTWLKWKNNGKDVPAIVLGSDETGVFPVNIANEYANVLELLEKDGVLDAQTQINELIDASNTYKF